MSIGILFSPSFLKSIGAETSVLTILLGTNFVSISFTSLLAGVLFKRYPMRSVGLLGAVLYFLGSSINAFATSVEMLIISYGILQGDFFLL